MEHMKNKTAIITGAGGGIGSALSKKLAGFGMNLVLVGRNKDKLENMVNVVGTTGGKAVMCIADLSDTSTFDQVIRTAIDAFGSVDVLINNAGLSHRSSVEEVSEELFDSIMKVNVRAPYFLSQKCIPELRKSDVATIINICSVVAHKGYPMQSAYATSKHALLGLTKAFANEVYKDNIRVHAISPGSVYTDMIAMVRPDLSPEGMILAEDIADIVGFYLAKRKSNAVIDEIELHRVNKEPFA